MKDIKSEDPDYNLWFLLAQTRNVLLRARRKELYRNNINHSQAAVLFIVQAIGDPATPAEIARWLFREPHSVSELLHRMEKDGLIEKVKDLDRKNQIRVVITEKGHETYRKSTKHESMHSIMSSLSKKDRKQLESLLKTIRDKALEETGVDYKFSFP